jgi:Family of unknown function (DUF5681)
MTKSRNPPHTLDDMKDAFIQGVGYRSPPTQHQFKKGQSGNPKGRPRKTDAADPINMLNLPQTKRMQDVLREPVTLNTASGTRLISLGEASQQTHKKIALVEGRTMPLLKLKKEVRDLERKELQAIAEDQDRMRDYIKNFRNLEERAKSKGLALEGFWILPENIVFHENAPCGIRGALTEEGLPYFAFLEKLLKLLIFEITYDCCYYQKPGDVMRAELKFIACLQKAVTAAAERASHDYWDKLEQDNVCSFWNTAQIERAKVWADVGWPTPRHQWLKPMKAKDRKIAERCPDPLCISLINLLMGWRQERRPKPRTAR